jgi:tetratricopeptide (TPR) repeat protein
MKDGREVSIYRRLSAALFSIAVCVIGIWFTSGVGYGRLLARYASLTADAVAAARAVELSPLDAKAHSTRAAVFYDGGFPHDAARELELAVSLRPKDYSLWLQLAVLRDELQEPEALSAFNEAVGRAPFYGHPKWQRGNYLLRIGRYDEAFADLRTAAASNQTLIPSLIDLAWGVSRENSELTKRLAGITDDRMRIAFARFLAKHGRGQEAIDQFRQSRVVSIADRRQLMADLIAANSFREAFEIWRGMERPDDRLTSIHDGSFESSNTFDDSGFGWRFANSAQGVRISLDVAVPQTGKQSLLVSFVGYSEASAPLLSQLILVERHKRYRVSFGARGENLVTGGLPIITVSEAAGNKTLLAQSEPIAAETSAWQSLSFDFETPNDVEAVELRLQRRPCKDAACPIFGSLWLDSFAIEELK